MDKELQNKLTDKVFEYLKNIEQFLVQEAPDFVSDYLTFIMIDTISNIVVASLIFAISIAVIYIVNKSTLNFINKEDRFFTKVATSSVIGVFVIVSFAHLIYYVTFLIQLYFAPKVAMIYYLSQMINK